MFRQSLMRMPWWNYTTEKRQKWTMMYGGNKERFNHNSLHRIYIRRFRRNAFPNRTRKHWGVAMTGISRQRPRRLPWPYDITSMIFNQAQQGSDKIGYVVGTRMLKTAVVASNHLVYYPKFNQRVARSSRFFAHDEDMACVEGDLVHIKNCRKISKYKHYYIFSILEPNIEGRERLKLGLPAVSPPLFGYPTSRRVVKLNLTSSTNTKEKLAAAIQEQVQDYYRFAGATGNAPRARIDENSSFDDANKMIGTNRAPQEIAPGGEASSQLLEGGEFTEVEKDSRTKRGDEFWQGQEPKEVHDYRNFSKSS